MIVNELYRLWMGIIKDYINQRLEELREFNVLFMSFWELLRQLDLKKLEFLMTVVLYLWVLEVLNKLFSFDTLFRESSVSPR